MLVTIVLEAHSAIAIDCVRVIRVDRLPLVIRRLELDFLLCNSHGDSAGDSGVDFLVGGREDYIKCLFASIADRGFCIVLIRPCERALNRLAVKGCRAAVQFEVEQLIAVGGAKIFQIECRLVLIRSRRSYNCLIFGHAVKLRPLLDLGFLLFAAVDRISQLLRGVNDIVRICCQSDHNGVGRVCLEHVPAFKLIVLINSFALIGDASHRQAGRCRIDMHIKVGLALDEIGDLHLGIGDLL